MKTNLEDKKFTMQDSLELLQDDVRMIASCVQKMNKPSLLIVLGESGLGKTEMVKTTLKDMRKDYAYVRGDIKNCGDFYKMLYQNNGRIIILDDSNTIIKKNSKFMSYLLAITDRGNNKRIAYLNNFDSDMKSSNNPDGKYPQQFQFTGSIICISNLTIGKLDEAFRSRAVINIIEASNEEIIEEVEREIDYYYGDVKLNIKKTTIHFLKEMIKKFPKHRIDFRTYQKAMEYFDLYSKIKAEMIIIKKIEQGII